MVVSPPAAALLSGFLGIWSQLSAEAPEICQEGAGLARVSPGPHTSGDRIPDGAFLSSS